MLSNNRSKIILVLTALGLIGFIWLFSKIIIYMLVAIILTFVSQPIVRLLKRIHISGKQIPDALVALVCIAALISVMVSFFYLFAPLLIEQGKFISTLNFRDVIKQALAQFPSIKDMLAQMGSEDDLANEISGKIQSFLSLGNAEVLLNSFLSGIASLAGAFLTIGFFTFFLLQDEKMASRTILLITPMEFEAEMKDILRTTRAMLSRYFVALFADVLFVTLLVGTLLGFMGVRNALFIAVFAGIMNIIPYIGPLISFSFACFLGITGCIQFSEVGAIGDVVSKLFWVWLSVNMVDGFLVQPFLFSSSVKAHPLEIFIVILMAASLAGVWGMIVAIPTYTLFRIIAKEFLVNFKFFKKMTENIPE